VKKATKADGINIVQNNGKVSGQEVFHYHVHVIPRFEGDGLKFDWPGKKYNDGEAAEVAQAIKENL
jgi:histidine triad (HIT) family protein